MQTIIFQNATLVDATEPDPREGIFVLVEDDRITEVSEYPIKASGAVEIDCHGRTLMPGLIDAHVHVTLTEVDLSKLADMPLTLMTAHAAALAKAMLDRGFTTIRDAGGADWGIAQAVEKGLFPGPRMFISGRALSQTGGHADHRSRTDSMEPCGCSNALNFNSVICDGITEVRRAVREELRKGAHQIKVMASGGVASPNDPLDNKQFAPDELRAIVEEATAWNTYVLAHAYTAHAIVHAVECGIRSIEHGNLVDQAAANLMAEKDVFMVPTLVTYDALNRRGKELGLPDVSLKKLKRVLEAGLGSIEICKAAGVKMGFGTDLLGTLQVDQTLEFSIRSEVLTPLEIIASATTTNAALLNREGELGVISPQAYADILVVDGNPLADIKVLQGQGENLKVIMKAGKFHKNELI